MTLSDRITDGAFPIRRPPSIRATGITVSSILALTASGKSAAEIVALNPSLEVEDVQAALEFLSVFLSRASVTSAATTLGIRRSHLIALLEPFHIPRPTARSLIPARPPKELSTRTKQHVEALFSPADRAEAERLLADLFSTRSSDDHERVHFGALRVSHGDLANLAEVVGEDWRDVLMTAGFAIDVHAHETWVPRRLTAEDRDKWGNGAQIEGVHFRCGEPVNLHRRAGIEGEPAAVLSLVALEPEPTYRVRTARPGPEEILTAFQSWLEPLDNTRSTPTGVRPADYSGELAALTGINFKADPLWSAAYDQVKTILNAREHVPRAAERRNQRIQRTRKRKGSNRRRPRGPRR